MKRHRILSLVAAMVMLLSAIGASTFLAAAADEKLLMEPGTIDNLLTEDYAQRFIVGTWKDGDDYVWNTPEQLASYMPNFPKNSWGDAWPELVGSMMGLVNETVWKTTAAWNGSSIIYRVVPGTYIATSLVGDDTATNDDCIKNHYVFETSADGSTWTPVAATVTKEHGNINGKSYFASHKAVVQIPAGAAYYRIVIGGFNPDATNTNEYTYAGGRTCCGAVANGIGTSVVSEYDLTQYSRLSAVPEFRKPVMDAGTFDDLEDEYYATRRVLSTWKDADNYDWNTEANLAASFNLIAKSADATKANFLGKFMGVANEFYLESKASWNGSSIIYEVVPGTYFATSLIGHAADAACLEHFGFAVSEDGVTWTAATPTISADFTMDATSAFDTWKAVLKIPEDVEYYRITLPGYNQDAANGNEIDYARRNDCDGKAFALGSSFASAYDLSQIASLTQVPDYPHFVDLKAALRASIKKGNAVSQNALVDGDEKDAFIDALAAAVAVEADLLATQTQVDGAVAALEAAITALVYKSLADDAHIAQDAPARILKPGVYDKLHGSPYKDAGGTVITRTDGVMTWTAYYTDYGKVGMYSEFENRYLNPETQIHATRYDFFYDYSEMSFMGSPIEAAYINCISWAGAYVDYRVYGGSYMASALIVNGRISDANFPKVQENYTFQVSADGVTYTNVDAELTLIDTVTELDDNDEEVDVFYLYKAVVKIPDGNSYYRIVMPGSDDLRPESVYTAVNVGYNHTFLGPTMASMYDLSDYDDFADVPDHTEWYADVTLAEKDTGKIQVTADYFKVIEEGMTVAEALAAVTVTNGSLAFYKADGTLIDDDTTVLAAGMKVDMLDAKGLAFKKAMGLKLWEVAMGSDLLRIDTLDPITVEYGAAKTAAGLKLPATVGTETGSGTPDAAINWNVADCDYDPEYAAKQTFTVTGTVVLPEGVTNNGGLSLEISVEVTVNGPEDLSIRLKGETDKIKIDYDNTTIYFTDGMTAGELLALLEPFGNVDFYVSLEDFETGEISIVPDDTKLTSDMTLDVYSADSGVLAMFFYLEVLSDDDGGGDNNTNTGVAGAIGSALGLALVSGAAAGTGLGLKLRRKKKSD